MIIAVTGSLGSGKSTVSKILARVLDAVHVDTDELCRTQMLPGGQGYREFLKIFGTHFLQADGTINRARLRREVFGDSQVREALERILHPLVRQQTADLARKQNQSGNHMVVEVPLLFEVGWQQDFDVWVVVYVPEERCLERVSARDGLSSEDIRRVFASQLPISLKLKYAHFVIDNSGTFVSSVLQLAWLGKKLKNVKNLDSEDLNTYKGNNDLKLNPCLC